MKLSIIFPDNMVVLDGTATEIDTGRFPLAAAIHAVQWDGTEGEIEWVDRNTPNAAISDLAMFQDLIAQAKTRIAEQVRAAQLAEESAGAAGTAQPEPSA